MVKRFRNKKARRIFFLKQYEGTYKRIWGTEFVISRLREAREDIRREYDKLNEELDAAKITYNKNEGNSEPDKTLRENFDKIIETKSKEIEEWKKRVDLTDKSIDETQIQIDSYYDQLPALEKRIYE